MGACVAHISINFAADSLWRLCLRCDILNTINLHIIYYGKKRNIKKG